jgi:hypothetical protein
MRAFGAILILLVFALAQFAAAQVNASEASDPGVSLAENAITTGTFAQAIDEEKILPKFDFLPPLGLDDGMQIVVACIYFLESPDAGFLDYKKQRVTEALNSVIDYVKMLDDRHSSFENYRWYFVGKQKVSGGGIDEDTFVAEPPLRRVSAISFVAERADVTIHRMTVTDVEGNETKFTIERKVRAGFPRKEVCFLYYQETVRDIILNYSTEDEQIEPRLKVYCGVTPMPEYAKEAIYFLTVAKKQLAENQLTSAENNLRKAWKRMLQVKKAWLRQ